MNSVGILTASEYVNIIFVTMNHRKVKLEFHCLLPKSKKCVCLCAFALQHVLPLRAMFALHNEANVCVPPSGHSWCYCWGAGGRSK